VVSNLGASRGRGLRAGSAAFPTRRAWRTFAQPHPGEGISGERLRRLSWVLRPDAGLPIMEAEGGGAIVNVTSTSGIRRTGSAQVAIQLSWVVAVQYAR
jgi:hypothetical protein